MYGLVDAEGNEEEIEICFSKKYLRLYRIQQRKAIILFDAADKGLIDKHVYALGGMDLENIKLAKQLGFGGVVVCGDLWSRFDIHNQSDFKDLIAHFEKLRNAAK